MPLQKRRYARFVERNQTTDTLLGLTMATLDLVLVGPLQQATRDMLLEHAPEIQEMARSIKKEIEETNLPRSWLA